MISYQYYLVPVFASVGGGFSWTITKYGKKKALILSCILTILGGSIQMIASRYAFIIGRGIIGAAFGLANAVSPMFISEISPANLRGVWVSMVQVWITAGLLVPLLMNFFIPYFSQPFSGVPDYWLEIENKHIIWREIFSAPILVAFIQLLLLLLVFTKENPIYYEYWNAKSGSGSTEPSLSKSDSESSLESSLHYDIQQSERRPLTKIEKDTWASF